MGREGQKDVTLDYVHSRHIDTSCTPMAHLDKAHLAAHRQDIKALSQKMGRPVNIQTLRPGDKGTYRGSVKMGGKRFGVIEHAKGVSLVPYKQLEQHRRGREMSKRSARKLGSFNQISTVGLICHFNR